MDNNYLIRQERIEDYFAVENLVRDAFWNVYRPGALEHYVLHCFRTDKDFVKELDLVLEKDGAVIGQIMYARANITLDDGRLLPILTFGPIAIAPGHKGKGYGTLLLEYSMEKAKALGATALAITGDIGYYGRFGFVVGSTKGVRYYAEPNGEAPYFLVKELKEGVLDGVSGTFKEPDGYYIDESGLDAFDAAFPEKIKLKTEGQLC